MKLGSIVKIRGKLDSRVRDKGKDAVYGTLDAFLCDGQVSVILENGDIYVGDKREVEEYKEASKKEEKNEEGEEN